MSSPISRSSPVSAPRSFRLHGLDFLITKARLEAFFRDEDDPEATRMVWHLAIHARGQPPAIAGVGDREWKMALQSDPGRLLETKPGEVRSWLDLAGREGGWTEREDSEGEPHACWCLYESEPIYACRWGLQRELDYLRLQLQARVDPHIDEGWMTGIELVVDTPLELEAIPFGRSPEADCRALVDRFGLTDELAYECEGGISRLRLVRPV